MCAKTTSNIHILLIYIKHMYLNNIASDFLKKTILMQKRKEKDLIVQKTTTQNENLCNISYFKHNSQMLPSS